MASNIAIIDVRKYIRFEVKVNYSKGVRVRLWLAVQLIRLAGWVAGFGGVDVMDDASLPERFKDKAGE